jgi:hypothetical protein
MNRLLSKRIWLVAAVMLLAGAVGHGEEGEPAADATPKAIDAASPAPDAKPINVKSPYRPLAPGVLVSIDPIRRLEETISRHDIIGLLAVDPQFDWAKNITFRHDVWVLKFQFKPIRIIWVDVPQPSGFMQRKPIWYMVYVVTNTGKIMHPVRDVKLPYKTFDEKELVEVKMIDQSIRFIPEFVLEGHQHANDDTGFTKAYPDRVIPVALRPIQMREDPARKLHTSVEMCREIAVGESVWGVATWEDIDPRIVRFSVYVFGLTNAYRWKDDPSEYKPGESSLTGRKLYRKTLKLNFWRPADQYHEKEKEIQYGVPGGVDYEWVYR